jgi:predicted solute-binding protein
MALPIYNEAEPAAEVVPNLAVYLNKPVLSIYLVAVPTSVAKIG